jgi:hypothetical protein
VSTLGYGKSLGSILEIRLPDGIIVLMTEGEVFASLASSEIENPISSNSSKVSKTRFLAIVILNDLGTFPL